jgi:hypothetical protein
VVDSGSISSMKKVAGERGAVSALLVSVVLISILFIIAASFAVWAFGGRQDYKNNVDSKVATAVIANTKTVQTKDALDYAEAAKSPLKTYVGPDAYGSVHISYPKTWSAYLGTSSPTTPLDAYFNPDVVPATDDQTSTYALRVQVVQSTYDKEVASYSDSIQKGQATAKPFSLSKVPSVVGTRVDGQIDTDTQGSIVLLPLRDKTLEIWTENSSEVADFNTYILPNITFSP